jgi:hypothetical protein
MLVIVVVGLTFLINGRIQRGKQNIRLILGAGLVKIGIERLINALPLLYIYKDVHG